MDLGRSFLEYFKLWLFFMRILWIFLSVNEGERGDKSFAFQKYCYAKFTKFWTNLWNFSIFLALPSHQFIYPLHLSFLSIFSLFFLYFFYLILCYLLLLPTIFIHYFLLLSYLFIFGSLFLAWFSAEGEMILWLG